MASSILDRLLSSTKVILKISDNRRGPMEYYLTLRINRLMLNGQLHLPIVEVDLHLRGVDSGLVTYEILDDRRGYGRRAWTSLTQNMARKEVQTYIASVYSRANTIAYEKGLFNVIGEVYQVEAFD